MPRHKVGWAGGASTPRPVITQNDLSDDRILAAAHWDR
jgi:hypothetical protein